MSAEQTELRIVARAILRKFDGDLTAEEIEAQKPAPVEVLLVEEGVVTGRWTGDAVRDAPSE